MTSTTFRNSAFIVVLLLVVAAFAACGGGDNGGGGGGTAAQQGGDGKCGGSAQAAKDAKAAAARYESYLKPPQTIAELGVTEPLKSKPAAGRKITYIGNTIPIVLETFEGVQEAAKALGWQATIVQPGATTAGLVDAVQKIVDSNQRPDGLVVVGPRLETVKDQVATLRKAGIPIVNWAGVDKPTPEGFTSLVNSPEFYTSRTRIETDWIIADSGGCAHIGFFLVRHFPVNVQMLAAQQDQLQKYCKECTIEVKDVDVTDIGKRIPTVAVSYVQTNPKINYLYTSLGGGLWAGVPQALEGAGLADKVKLTTDGADATTFEDVANGRQFVAADQTPIQMGWHMVDSFARAIEGTPIACKQPCEPGWNNEPLPKVLITPSNVGESPDPKSFGVVPGFRDQYSELWHLR